MGEIDWTIRGPDQRGLAVEGPDDKTILEALLDAGERESRWSDWRSRLRVEPTGKNDNVLRELQREDYRGTVWGIIDRDWRSDAEVAQLEVDYPLLRVLPRIAIENYCVDPDEIVGMLPDIQLGGDQAQRLRDAIEGALANWLEHGALSQVLYESGANEFCRAPAGYPAALLTAPVPADPDLHAILERFRSQLDPATILPIYRTRITSFQGLGRDRYRRCISGKLFFNGVVVSRALNQVYRQQSRDAWITDLFAGAADCPDDLVPILTAILA
jgi:hypothetical protein